MKNQNQNQQRKSRSPMVDLVDLWWDQLQLAPDGTYSTTLRVSAEGNWPSGLPDTATLAVTKDGKKVEILVELQGGRGEHVLVGIPPGCHYLFHVTVGPKTVQSLLIAPSPKSANEEVKQKEPEVPDELRVTVSGWGGKYKLLISVLKSGAPLVGFKGTVFNGVAQKTFTTKLGGAVYAVKFKKSLQYLEVSAGGQRWSITLPGP